ncbi:MAM and LDL-receptor class A domain-containing protein 1-like [Saccoglossus kowalevskii]
MNGVRFIQSYEVTSQNGPYDCDFENDFCSWMNDPEAGEEWLREQGSTGLRTQTGPPADHTTGTQEGWYAYVQQTLHIGLNVQASLTNPAWTGPKCLTFWYHMYGSSLGSLSVLLDTGQMIHESIWSRSGNVGSNWNYAQVHIEETGTYNVIIESRATLLNIGVVALDDIIVYDEDDCPPLDICDFEYGVCEYTNDQNADAEWNRTKADNHVNGPDYDHSTGTSQGNYVYMDTNGMETGKYARLLSPLYSSSLYESTCLQFWYYIHGGSGGATLSVYIKENDDLGTPIWETEYDQGGFWHIASAEFIPQTEYQVVFEGSVDQQGVYDISLDDISVNIPVGGCTGLHATCNFEYDMCTWTNVGYDDFDWIRYSGSTSFLPYLSGPTKDHTTGSIHGWYMFIESGPPSSSGDKARLVSEVFMPNQNYCFLFYYHMYGLTEESPGTIRIVIEYTDETEQELWRDSENKGDRWQEQYIDIFSTKAFRIAIEGEVDAKFASDLAIDDTKMFNYSCNPPSYNFTCSNGTEIASEEKCNWVVDCPDASDELNCGECTFENGTCEYNDNSRGEYRWERWSGPTPTPNTGPSHDHTWSGEQPGYYMLAASTKGGFVSAATLDGPLVRECHSTCQVVFYYHMFGSDIGKLEAFILENGLETRLWIIQENQGDEWHQAWIPIGRIYTDWQLFFRCDRSFGEEGDIAIDDIIMHNCALPEIRECVDDEIQCDRGSCVASDELCDFVDNCGDATDESDEYCGSYTRCTFEFGVCGFRQDHTDDWDWDLENGRSASVLETGPSRDHTVNTAAGHYVLLNTRLPKRANEQARLISGTFSPGNCKLLFHYHMYGSSCGSLVLYTRTEIGVPMKNIWWEDEPYGDVWVSIELDLSEVKVFEIVFEATVGDGIDGDIALDDISISPECPPTDEQLPIVTPEPVTRMPTPCTESEFYCNDGGQPECISIQQKCDFKSDCTSGSDESICGTCDFETSQCGWIDTSSGIYTWDRMQVGQSSSEHAPATDGLGRNDGYYMVVEGDDSRLYIGAYLETDVTGRIGRCCVASFYYHMDGQDSGAMAFYLQDPNDNLNLALLWTKQGDQGSRWKRAEVFVGSHGSGWRFDVEAYPLLGTLTGDYVDIAIDEIVFIDCHPDQTKENVYDISCDFEEDFCGWLQVASDTDDDSFDWTRMSGPTESRATGPDHDHTKGKDGEGYYLYTEATKDFEKTARLTVYPQPPTSMSCISFYYHMYGSTVGSLTIYQQRLGFPETSIWTRSGTWGNEWHYAQKTVSHDDNQYQIHIEGVTGHAWASDIAIDDIKYEDGQCPTTVVCDFEIDFCDWVNGENDDMDWRRGNDGTPSSGTGPENDHTTGTSDGYFSYIETSKPRRAGDRAHLLSPVYPGGTSECLEFWYHMSGEDIGSLRVFTQDVASKEQVGEQWEKSTHQGSIWRYAHYSAYSDEDYRIVIEGTKGEDTKGDIAIDDLRAVEGACGLPGYCNFDNGMCGWTNNMDDDDFDWLRNYGTTLASDTGPSYDHTTATYKGFYMYTESSIPVVEGDISWLISEHFEATDQSCFIFYYHMYGDDNQIQDSLPMRNHIAYIR